MSPIDFRNATFADIQGRLEGSRLVVFLELSKHGPCTTRELARRSGIDLLSIRPRVTELVDLGLVALDEELSKATKHEGVYRALPEPEAEALFIKRRFEANREQQLELVTHQ